MFSYSPGSDYLFFNILLKSWTTCTVWQRSLYNKAIHKVKNIHCNILYCILSLIVFFLTIKQNKTNHNSATCSGQRKRTGKNKSSETQYANQCFGLGYRENRSALMNMCISEQQRMWVFLGGGLRRKGKGFSCEDSAKEGKYGST